MTKSLSSEFADGQRKLAALALAGENSESVNPLITQNRNGPVGSFHAKVRIRAQIQGGLLLLPCKEVMSRLFPGYALSPHKLIHGEIMELGHHSVTGSQDERRWPSRGFDHVLEKKPWARVRRSVS
ncbi:transducin/WD40 repeat-like superfamily protein [Artemisia annua]|uniref:Transducin/WD40 repeat-like superfamily protein n=1 Tax=Artemisia annua TaxID=35608 RepID=A0A2U1K9F8_ARTAN|nr:transducin/WD40 repeat-like superfamily protein [Artemisia annua]